MKRPISWRDGDDENDDDDSSTSGSEDGAHKTKPSKATKQSQGKSSRQKSKIIDFEALRRHGYKGGLSVLSVPPPKDDTKQDWSWSTGKEHQRTTDEIEESFEERQKTRAAIVDAEQLSNVQAFKDKKNLSFSQKEKRKRDLGQASRGKNYVEEEKRLLRDNGVYSGFDT